MKRLTASGVIYGDNDFIESDIYEALNKLSKYEDTRLDPEEVEQIRTDKDYWHKEAIKWGAMLGEMRF